MITVSRSKYFFRRNRRCAGFFRGYYALEAVRFAHNKPHALISVEITPATGKVDTEVWGLRTVFSGAWECFITATARNFLSYALGREYGLPRRSAETIDLPVHSSATW